MNIETKKCSKCGETKTVDLFPKRENQCKACVKVRQGAYYKKHCEKIKARTKGWSKNNPQKKAENDRAWRENNPERKKKNDKAWNENNKERRAATGKAYYENNKEEHAARCAIWRKNNPDYEKLRYDRNPGKNNAKCAKRRAMRMQRTPVWSETKEIEDLYIESQRLTKETGIKHEVDHVLPLQGELVSGLHVIGNLQILTAHENRSKSNRYDTT